MRKFSIMHADDDEDIRSITGMALEVMDEFTLRQFPGGMELLEAARTDPPDLFLLDYVMPGFGGRDVWERLQTDPDLKRIPVVFMTAKAEQETERDLLGLGALAVVPKPFDPLELGERLLSELRKIQT